MTMEGKKSLRDLWMGIVGMVLLICSTATILFGAHAWKRDLRVASVMVLGARILPASDIVTQAGIGTGDKLYAVNLSGVKRKIEANPFVQKATVQRDAPDRITILLEEREPLAAVMTDHVLYLDPEGFVLPSVRSEQVFDLPLITGTVPVEECVPGKRIASAPVLEALAFLAFAKRVGDEMYHRISEVHLEDQHDMVLYTAEFGIPVIVGRGDAAEKLMKLEAFWKDVVNRQGAQGLQYVDLRYSDQVVVRWNRGRSGGGE